MTIKKTTQPPIRVGLIALGCAKNLVDAEVMLGRLASDGMEITNDSALADVVIVNTCSFIESAQQESVDAILESDHIREIQNRGQGLIVAGCLPQRFREELPKLLPEVDAFMGIDQLPETGTIVRQALAHRAARLRESGSEKPAPESHRKRRSLGDRNAVTIPPAGDTPMKPDLDLDGQTPSAGGAPLVVVHDRPTFIPDYAMPRFRLTPKHFAYVKIAEGCNHPCSFCIIPRMRGSHRSRPQADVVTEARQLVEAGVKELNLISQDTTYYGLDLRANRQGATASPGQFSSATRSLAADATTLCTLIRELNDFPEPIWIRLLYTHPAHWTDPLIQTIAACKKVARYVDIPLQHIHPVMLERMRRETSRDYIVDLLARIRTGIPGIALRTTFIVGFPGETEEHFETLLEFIEQTRFERLGIFTYSAEEGTRAGKMAGQVPAAVKNRRRDKAMALQRRISRNHSQAFIGDTPTVLVEKAASATELRQAQVHSWEHGMLRGRDPLGSALQGAYLVARGETDAPDIDGRVYVKGSLPLGEFARVQIVGHTDYDLIAQPA